MIAKSLAEYIEDQGLGWTFGVNLFVSRIPSTPDTCLAIWGTGGPEGIAGQGYDNPTVQIRSRSSDPELAHSQLMAVYAVLESSSNFLLGTQRVVNCRGVQSEPVSIGRDEAGRDEYTMNFQLRVRNKTVNRE